MAEAVAEQMTLATLFQQESLEAYPIDDDQIRHANIVEIVAPTTSQLAVESLGDALTPDGVETLTNIYKEATEDASNAFIDGNDRGVKPKNYAPLAAVKHKEEIYKLLHPETEENLERNAEKELEQATLRDMFEITKQILLKKGVDVSNFNYSQVLVGQIIEFSKAAEGTEDEDYIYTWDFKDRQEGFEEFLRKGESQDPAGHDHKYLETMVRLANSTWAAGQIHRSREEKKTNRITKDMYLPYDEMILKQYENFRRDESVSDEQAFAYVAYIVYKDLYELQKAQNQIKN